VKWSLRKAYLYVVSLVTFIMSLVGFWNLASNAVDLIWPAPSYWTCTPTEKDGAMDEESLRICEEQRQEDERRQVIYRQQGLAKSAIFLVIVVPAYLYHWKQANRAEEENRQA